MKKYTCTALIKYSKEEVSLHINALSMAILGFKDNDMHSYIKPYKSLLKDMKRIESKMTDKENNAILDRLSEEELTVEGSVIKNV